MADVTLWLAFAGGVLSFLSPCVFPLIPGYLSYLTGVSPERAPGAGRSAALFRTMAHAALFCAGFSTVFIALGLTATSVGRFLTGNLFIFQRVAGILIIVFGLQMTGLLRISWLMRERHLEVKGSKAGAARSYLIGCAFGFGWTPCVGPLLGSVLTMAASQGRVLAGGVLLLAYSLGICLPFLATAALLSLSLGFALRSGRALAILQIVGGAVMILMGVLLVSGYFPEFTSYLARFTPDFVLP